ncbi:hypothetical protein AB0A05_22315 [Streptomyces sp. NPDC046374]|uniref:hypothetical protein n=1 Tax=Streptomyces sp. NPDC046374 TaxID=3154917 RepID=UPI0033F6927F
MIFLTALGTFAPYCLANAAMALAACSRSSALQMSWTAFFTVAPTSIVFAVLAYIQLPKAEADFVVNVTAATVLLSVVLHGVSAEPIARWFVRHPQPEERVGPPGPGR